MASNNILKRGFPGWDTQDVGAIANLEYNNAAGGQKVLEVSRKLIPIPNSATTWTTNTTTLTPLPKQGLNLAIYNNSDVLDSVTVGNSSITLLVAGVTDTNGNVGIPLMPNTWTYIACGYANWVITGAATSFSLYN